MNPSCFQMRTGYGTPSRTELIRMRCTSSAARPPSSSCSARTSQGSALRSAPSLASWRPVVTCSIFRCSRFSRRARSALIHMTELTTAPATSAAMATPAAMAAPRCLRISLPSRTADRAGRQRPVRSRDGGARPLRAPTLMVPPRRLFFKRPVRDPLEIAAELADEGSRFSEPAPGDLPDFRVGPAGEPRSEARRLLLAYHPQHFEDRLAAQRTGVEWQRADEQLVQHDPERIDVGPRIDARLVSPACSGLMYSGVPTSVPIWCPASRPVSALLSRLGDAEVDDLDDRLGRR